MDFPASEFEVRLQRAQVLMHEAGLDALFLMSEPEIRYLSGFRTLFWQSPTRPWFLVVPAKGKPIAVIPEIGAALMRQTWIEDIRTWASPDEVDDGVSLLASVLSKFPKIGIMMGRESGLRMPLADFSRVKGKLPDASFVDASLLIAALRFVKSEAEINVLRTICGITCDAFDQAGALFYAGQPRDEAFRAFKIELLKQGAEEVPYLVGGAGPLGYDDVISPPDQTPLQKGEVLMLDTGATLKGYFCDFDRNFAFGNPADAVKKAHETLWLATQSGLEKARPGATCADLFHAMQKVIGETGGGVGRYGHGLGIQLTEYPSVIDWDQTIMQEGAVMTLEPSIAIDGGGVLVHEENIVIRDGAPELLTRRAPREMIEIS